MQDRLGNQYDEPLEGVIFDRDGVLLVDRHYMISPDDISWIAGAVDLIRLLNLHSVKVMVATNQSGVARGYFDQAAVEKLHLEITDQLESQGLWIDAIEYCPHHPTEGSSFYTTSCLCRKPSPGMLLKLMDRFDIQPKRTLMIGDRQSDMQASNNAGVEGFLFRGTNLLEEFRAAGHLNRLPVTNKSGVRGLKK
jgi:D-glycero-D-manno-heptose 1,7-bisphosphate phosphatase